MMVRMMSTARNMMITTAKRKPTISPIPTLSATIELVLDSFFSVFGVVMLKTDTVGWVVDSVCSGQMGSSRLSITVLQFLSR